ncbi:MAG: hypothetical protein IJU52_08840 [Clostridia bacterium]|nr:hypothetical protein [Clostridia bacterium]
MAEYIVEPKSRADIRRLTKVDIEYSMHQGKMTLHAHDYVNGVRQPYRDLTPEEYEEYGKYFGGSK